MKKKKLFLLCFSLAYDGPNGGQYILKTGHNQFKVILYIYHFTIIIIYKREMSMKHPELKVDNLTPEHTHTITLRERELLLYSEFSVSSIALCGCIRADFRLKSSANLFNSAGDASFR